MTEKTETKLVGIVQCADLIEIATWGDLIEMKIINGDPEYGTDIEHLTATMSVENIPALVGALQAAAASIEGGK